ncbi:MAG: hypothetical protein OHK0029_26050 [Armatimonadaceae bacterium]
MLNRRDSIAFRLVDAFFRNWIIFCLCVVGVSSVVSVALLTRSQTYSATASIQVLGDTGIQSALGITQYTRWDSPAQINANRFNVMMQMVAKDGFVDKVLQEANLDNPINIDPEANDPRFKMFRKNVFTTVQGKEVFQIGLVWESPDECERLVESLRSNFIEQIGANNRIQAADTTSMLDSQIKIYKKRLQDAEQALMDYKRMNAGKLPDSQQAEIEQLANLKMERDYLVITSNDNSLKRQALQKRLEQVQPVSVLEQTLRTDPLMTQLRDLEARRNSFIAEGWQPTGTQIGTIDRQIEQVRAQLAQRKLDDPLQTRNIAETKIQDNPVYLDLMQQLTEVDIEENRQVARVELLNRQIAAYEARIQQLPAAERMLVEKTRDREVVRKTYEDLWARREQAKIKAEVDRVTAESAFKMISPIYAEPTMGKSKVALMLTGSVILGIVVGFLMILVREFMDSSLRYEADAARILGVPVLAALPESPVLQFPVTEPKGLFGRLTATPTRRLPDLGSSH